MARFPVVKAYAILDTSWLLELYQVPMVSRKERHSTTVEQTRAARGRMVVTVPVLFEFANHIVRVDSGNKRRTLVEKYLRDVERSLGESVPWTIYPNQPGGVLLTTEDFLGLVKRFSAEAPIGHSLADISVMDLASRFRARGCETNIFAFDRQLESYAG